MEVDSRSTFRFRLLASRRLLLEAFFPSRRSRKDPRCSVLSSISSSNAVVCGLGKTFDAGTKIGTRRVMAKAVLEP